MAHDAHAGVGGEHALQAGLGLVGAVGQDHHAGVEGVAHADPAAVVEADPAGTVHGVDHRVEDGPVGDGVGAVLGRGAVAQNLDLAQGDRRNRGDVGALGTVGHTVAQPVDHRRPMATPSQEAVRLFLKNPAGARTPLHHLAADHPITGDNPKFSLWSDDDSAAMAENYASDLATLRADLGEDFLTP